jgi:hypothetical protein
MTKPASDRSSTATLLFGLALLFSCIGAMPATAGTTGKIQGKIVATDTGEPIGFADVLLIPADTTMHRVGGLTNADGTYLLEAPAGRYTLQIRALSYGRKLIEGIAIEADKLLPMSTALVSYAIQQEEIVVEGKAIQNTEAALLSARKKASSLGDAVSAEQVRKTPDKDAAEVLRRVTGLSVADGKYVFVRGLGERYSSTEVDGVRIASPEQNKRVVPLDLVPANLLDHITVQKTYTADRPGEFGGGDVQLRTKDFPGARTLSFSVSQGFAENVTFKDRLTYASTRADIFGFGADARRIPQIVNDVAGSRPLSENEDPTLGFPKSTLAQMGRSFANVWSPVSNRAIPNASYSASYGDEFKVFGRPLGLVQSWALARSFDRRDESARFFNSEVDTLYDYQVQRFQESVMLSGVSALSYRLSPRHTLHLRGLYTNSADDEVRLYEGPDHNRVDSQTGTFLHHRSTRLMYVERTIASGTMEGTHDFSHLLGAQLNWKVSLSEARRQQPDRRETIYDRRFSPGPNGTTIARWILGSPGNREYGDLKDEGRGGSISASLPYRLGPLGNGKLVLGYDRQTKDRTNFYRRFNLYPATNVGKAQPPEVIFDDSTFHGGNGTAYVSEATLSVDNYRAQQRTNAGFLSADVPMGRNLRGSFGVRAEDSFQDIESFDLFFPDIVTQSGRLDDRDWLPSANLTWAMTEAVNLRLGASRTVSRPDLNELSSSPALEYVGGYQVAGNPNLRRALIDNYDVRVEAFPALSEVLAAGFFYKHLHEPIEQVIQGGSPNLLIPRNSDFGRNLGVELEARSGLNRVWRRLTGFSINANATIINSTVRLKERVTELGSNEHPLQGQASYLVNGSLGYTAPSGAFDMTLMMALSGKRLTQLAEGPLGDIYEQPSGSLDAAMIMLPWQRFRLKLAAKNLLDPRVRQLHGGLEESGYRKGRSYSLSLSYPS